MASVNKRNLFKILVRRAALVVLPLLVLFLHLEITPAAHGSNFPNVSVTSAAHAISICFGECGSDGGPDDFSSGSCGGTTIGSILCNMDLSWALVPSLLTGLSYLFGIFLGVMAIIKIKEHVEDPRSVKMSEAGMRFAAGGAFLALPMVIEATVNTLAPGGIFFGEDSGFNSADVSGSGLDAMVVALMADIWTPISALISGFGYLAGIVFIMIGISRLLKHQQEGPRGPAGMGTIATFLTGGALMSLDSMMGGWSNSLFTTGEVSTFASLAFTAGMSTDELAHVNAVISGAEAFLMVLGWISFVRGFFIVRGVADGDQQASLMAGLTHLFGGALAVNIGPVMNAVQSTLGLTGYGVDFS